MVGVQNMKLISLKDYVQLMIYITYFCRLLPPPDLLAGVSTINQPTTNRPTDTCTIVKAVEAFDVHCTYTCSKIHYI